MFNIFDLFSVRKESKKIFTRENLLEVLNLAKWYIIDQAKNSLRGAEKKQIVDSAIINIINEKTKDCKNSILLWIIERIKGFIPTITQYIYDTLKEKVDNL